MVLLFLPHPTPECTFHHLTGSPTTTNSLTLLLHINPLYLSAVLNINFTCLLRSDLAGLMLKLLPLSSKLSTSPQYQGIKKNPLFLGDEI
jgi:hypothetical protein